MNPERVGKFIKEIRKKNNLTQKELADKYGVTYQAVSKWENGINLPEVTLLRQMSKDFNISMESILDGELVQSKTDKKNLIIPISILIIIIISALLIFVVNKKDNSFKFKTISTTCNDFKVSGSIAYDKDKSSIYISQINYCGGNDNNNYKEIECNLYEQNDDTITKISSCKSETSNIKLEDYLKKVEFNVESYTQVCKNFNNNSLYLEINATDENNKTTVYKIPLSLNKNCPK